MKPSQFNIIINRDNHTYWYNSLTRKYFRISRTLNAKIEKCILNNDFEILPASIVEKLQLGGFIIEDNTDEISLIRQRNNESILKKDYFLIILPTLNCNYHCWYCIQDHIESKMSEETTRRLKRHIDHMIDVEKIDSLHMDWFGGEPFLYFKDIIIPISEYAINKCKDAGISFMNSSTTNGYFLSNDVITKCKDLEFKQFQITLDGDMKFHDKVKFQNGCESTFSHVLKNINNLIGISKDTILYLRINYTHKNLSEAIVDEVNQLIDRENRHNIVITPRKVWQEDTDPDFHKILIKILDKFRNSGYLVEYWNPAANYLSCYTNKKYYNAINYSGNVVKCTACNDLYDKNYKGILLKDGTIEWKDNYDENYWQPTFENERCLNCNKLPICMGLCPKENLKDTWYCKEDAMDTNFENSIVNFIDRNYEVCE